MSRPTAVRFGPFRFDLQSGDLFRGTRRIPLTPQSITVLCLLVRRPGELVSRTELQRELWGERHIQADLGLNFCIRQVRLALEDPAEDPEYIETLRGRGYRFMAPVSRWPGRHPAHYRVVAAMLLIAAVGLGLAWSSQPRTITLAVTQFANLTDAEGCGIMGNRAAATIRQTIAGADPSRILVLQGSEAEANGKAAEYLLVGTVSGEPQHRRVAVHLLRARDGAVLWSRVMDPATALAVVAAVPIVEQLERLADGEG